MKTPVAIGLILCLSACSESGQREAVLKRSNELEAAWNSFDEEGMTFLDTFKRAIFPWVHDSVMVSNDSTMNMPKQKFTQNDSLNKIFKTTVSQLQIDYFKYEKQLIDCKKMLHGFLSWKLLVTNRDIEPGTASADLLQYRKMFDSVSVVMRKSFRIHNGDISEFRNFIQATQKADTLQNTTP